MSSQAIQKPHYGAVPPTDASEQEWIAWANAWPTLGPLGLACTALTATQATFVVAREPFVPNPNGAVNGGIVAAMADQAMGVLGARACDPDMLPRTASLHVQFHRPVRAPIELAATLLPGGRRVQFIEVVLRDDQGVRYATANGTMAVVRASDGIG